MFTGTPARSPDFQHLFYRFCQGIPFAPDMTGEIAAVLAAYFCQKDKILGLAGNIPACT